MTITSAITGKSYQDNKVVNFYNYDDILCYLKHGALPVDLFPSSRGDRIIFTFLKEDHERLKHVARVERIRKGSKKHNGDMDA